MAARSFPSVHQCVLRGEQSSCRKRCHGAWTAQFEVSRPAESGLSAWHALGVRGSGSNGQSLWGPQTVQELLFNCKNSYQQDYFPGGPLVKNLPASAGDMRLIPGLGRFHVPWGNWACVHNCWGCALEPALCNNRGPYTANRESTCAAVKPQCSQKENKPFS